MKNLSRAYTWRGLARSRQVWNLIDHQSLLQKPEPYRQVSRQKKMIFNRRRLRYENSRIIPGHVTSTST
jgi:hypothetical protein